ncbi:MAG: helix-turn-helix transcriptional regulator [Francisella endosymbiont of Hyalomma asiaticum]
MKTCCRDTLTGKTTIYRWISKNQFPKPINLLMLV